MKNFIVFSFVLCMFSCSTKSPKEMLLGEWHLVSAQFLDPSLAPKKMLNTEFVRSRYETSGYSISFDENNRYRIFEHGVEDQPHDQMFFKITDENLVEKDNGDYFDIYMYEDDGSLYQGGNKPGPFKIVELSKNKLVLQNRETRYQAMYFGDKMTPELESIIRQEENILLVYERKQNAVN